MSDLALLQPRSMSKSLMLDETRLQGQRLERFHVNQGCEDPAVVLERHTHAGVDGCKVDVWRHTHLQESLIVMISLLMAPLQLAAFEKRFALSNFSKSTTSKGSSMSCRKINKS